LLLLNGSDAKILFKTGICKTLCANFLLCEKK
jgi:hypothetical protein